jgi:hypothetical protein
MTLNARGSQIRMEFIKFHGLNSVNPLLQGQIIEFIIWHSGSGHYTILCIFVPYNLAPLFLTLIFYFSFSIASPSLHASAITMMAPNNTTVSTAPIYNLPDLKKVDDDEIAYAIYEIVLATKAHEEKACCFIW